jgi:peptidylprolyl isomerase
VASGPVAPDSAWRTVDQDNLMYIKTKHGTAIVELFPEIAPKHVAQIKALTGRGFYDFVTFHRVIDGFMNQTGDPTGTGTGDSDLPDIDAEFTFRRAPTMKITLVNKRAVDVNDPQDGTVDVGFYNGLPVATRPAMQAALTKDGKVEAWGLHCKGVTSMARSSEPGSANSQFFLMRDEYSSLDRKYSIWGNTVMGRDVLTKIKVGSKGENSNFVPDQMDKVTIGSAMPAGEQLAIQVLKTDSAAFKAHLTSQKMADGNYPDICDIDVPTRIKP